MITLISETMTEQKEIKLFGSMLSEFSKMVRYALSLKGISYDYVEVDMKNKSEEFLRMNPVHKKVPVLVVDGKPIAESVIILQYIDETWKNPPIMPQDPYTRSKVRFWADFFYQKMVPVVKTITGSKGEAQKKAVEELIGHLKALEDGVNRDVHVQGSFIHGEKPGLLDVILGPCWPGLKQLEQGLAGVKLLDDKWTPLLCSSMDAYAELDVILDFGWKEVQILK